MKELKETVSWLNYYIKNFDIDRIIYFSKELNKLGYIENYEVEWLVQDIINNRCTYNYKTFLREVL